MQIQMQCCDLPVGHYLECAFSQYTTDEQYLEETLDSDENKGVLVRRSVRDIVAPPLELWDDPLGQLHWAKENARPEDQIVRWKMIAWNLIETKRNRPWMAAVLPALRQAYHELLHFDHAKAQEEDLNKPKRARKEPPPKPDSAAGDVCGDSGDEEESRGLDMCGDDDDEGPTIS